MSLETIESKLDLLLAHFGIGVAPPVTVATPFDWSKVTSGPPDYEIDYSLLKDKTIQDLRDHNFFNGFGAPWPPYHKFSFEKFAAATGKDWSKLNPDGTPITPAPSGQAYPPGNVLNWPNDARSNGHIPAGQTFTYTFSLPEDANVEIRWGITPDGGDGGEIETWIDSNPAGKFPFANVGGDVYSLLAGPHTYNVRRTHDGGHLVLFNKR